jgi:hypothetical protein
MRRREKSLAICLLLSLIVAKFAFAQEDSPSSRLTLRGLTRVAVYVTEKTDCPGIDSTVIKIETELELRKLGIEILEEKILSPILAIFLVWCSRNPLNNSDVIPAKLALASASRNPGISKTPGCPLSRA